MRLVTGRGATFVPPAAPNWQRFAWRAGGAPRAVPHDANVPVARSPKQDCLSMALPLPARKDLGAQSVARMARARRRWPCGNDFEGKMSPTGTIFSGVGRLRPCGNDSFSRKSPGCTGIGLFSVPAGPANRSPRAMPVRCGQKSFPQRTIRLENHSPRAERPVAARKSFPQGQTPSCYRLRRICACFISASSELWMMLLKG